MNVRVHADRAATVLAGDVDARAFTVGEDIYFDGGEYDPNTSSGRHLLRHELVHVLQQRTGTSGSAQALETEARALADGTAPVPRRPGAGSSRRMLQREAKAPAKRHNTVEEEVLATILSKDAEALRELFARIPGALERRLIARLIPTSKHPMAISFFRDVGPDLRAELLRILRGEPPIRTAAEATLPANPRPAALGLAQSAEQWSGSPGGPDHDVASPTTSEPSDAGAPFTPGGGLAGAVVAGGMAFGEGTFIEAAGPASGVALRVIVQGPITVANDVVAGEALAVAAPAAAEAVAAPAAGGVIAGPSATGIVAAGAAVIVGVIIIAGATYYTIKLLDAIADLGKEIADLGPDLGEYGGDLPPGGLPFTARETAPRQSPQPRHEPARYSQTESPPSEKTDLDCKHTMPEMDECYELRRRFDSIDDALWDIRRSYTGLENAVIGNSKSATGNDALSPTNHHGVYRSKKNRRYEGTIFGQWCCEMRDGQPTSRIVYTHNLPGYRRP